MAEVSLGVKIWGDVNEFLTAIKKAEKELTKFSKTVGKIGKEMSEAFTLPFIGIAVVAVREFGAAEKAAASLTTQIRANGKDVQTTLKDYNDFAAEMQRLTVVEDDAVTGLLQLAESMQAPNAKQAAQDAIALNAALGIDMETAVKLSVKAQEGQFTALAKLVPAIKGAGSESEKLAIYQKLTADGFQIAQAQAQAGLGPLEQLKNQLGNVAESFGKLISEALLPIVTHLKNAIMWVDGLDESTKKWIVGIAAAVATIGPLMLVISKTISGMIALKGAIVATSGAFGSLMTFLVANPWLAVAAAIGVATVALGNWYNASVEAASLEELNKANGPDKARLEQEEKDLQEYLSLNKKGQKEYLEGWKQTFQKYKKQFEEKDKAGQKAEADHLANLANQTLSFIHKLEKASKGQVSPLAGISGDAEKSKGVLAELNDQIGKLEIQLQNEIAANNANAASTAALLVQKKQYVETLKAETDQLQLLYSLKPATPSAAPTYDPRAPLSPISKMEPLSSPATLTGSTPTATINPQPIVSLTDKLKAMSSAFDMIAGKLGGIYRAFQSTFSSIANLVGKAAEGFKGNWKDAVASVLEVASSVMSLIGSITSQSFAERSNELDAYYTNEKERIENSSLSQVEKAKRMDKLDKETAKKKKQLAYDQAKQAKTSALIQAIISGALAVVTALSAGPVLGIVLAAIVGALAAVEIATIASQPLPALAGGGLAMAPTLAMVGDNPNARFDPEVIAPLSKLRDMLTPSDGGGILSARVSGDDLLFVMERAGQNRKRTRGF